MLPKKKRVTKDLFQDIMKHGKAISSPFFLFRYLPHPTPRYAFVAPKGIAKKATERIALRRRGYRALLNTPLLPLLGIFFYKKEGVGAQTLEIKSDIENLLKRIKA